LDAASEEWQLLADVSSSPFFSNCLSCEDGNDIVPKRR